MTRKDREGCMSFDKRVSCLFVPWSVDCKTVVWWCGGADEDDRCSGVVMMSVLRQPDPLRLSWIRSPHGYNAIIRHCDRCFTQFKHLRKTQARQLPNAIRCGRILCWEQPRSTANRTDTQYLAWDFSKGSPPGISSSDNANAKRYFACSALRAAGFPYLEPKSVCVSSRGGSATSHTHTSDK